MSEILQLFREKEVLLEIKVRECDIDRSNWRVLDKEYKNTISQSNRREHTLRSVKDDLLGDLELANEQIQDLKEEMITMRNSNNILYEQLSK